MPNKQPIIYIPGLILVIFTSPVWLLIILFLIGFSGPEEGIYTASTVTSIVIEEVIAQIKGKGVVGTVIVLVILLPLFLLTSPRLRRIKSIAVLVPFIITLWLLYVGLTASLSDINQWKQMFKLIDGSSPTVLETRIGRTGVWSERAAYTRKVNFEYPKTPITEVETLITKRLEKIGFVTYTYYREQGDYEKLLVPAIRQQSESAYTLYYTLSTNSPVPRYTVVLSENNKIVKGAIRHEDH